MNLFKIVQLHKERTRIMKNKSKIVQKHKIKSYIMKNCPGVLTSYHYIKKNMGKIFFEKKNAKLCSSSNDYFQSVKGAFKGCRCFIIGNGPSLSANDLDKLEGEICFASNKIYTILDQTIWHPTFYCVQDIQFLKHNISEILSEITADKFIAVYDNIHNLSVTDAKYIRCITLNDTKCIFSDDITRGYFDGCTVTYMCLQIAAYMGFSDIYLLGIDHNYSISVNIDGSVVKHDGVVDHFDRTDKLENIPQLEKSTLAYQAAKEYADSHGIKIYNATRGGKLEVFERVDFDSLFPPEDSENNAPKIDK